MADDRLTRRQAWMIAAACLAVFLLSVGLRIAEYRRWERPELAVQGEQLLATNDAYFWVAGAEGSNSIAQPMPMAVLLRLASRILSAPPAELSFWGAAVLAALAVVPAALWCFELGAPYAAFLAPVLIGLAPAFYNRTRLGFYDSDWAALFFPLLTSWLLARWIRPRLRGDEENSPRSKGGLTLPALIILAIAFGRPWHPFIGLFTLAVLGLAGVLVVFKGRPEASGTALLTLLAIALPAGWGWIGAGAGLLLAWWSGRRPVILQRPWVVRISAATLILLLAAIVGLQFQEYLLEAARSYLGRFTGGGAADLNLLELAYPSVSGSVRETQDIGLVDILQGAGFHPLLGLLGTVGFLILCWKRLPALFLLPLLALGLAAVRMGIRFTMFAAPPVILGLLVPLEWVLRRTGVKRGWKSGNMAAFAGAAALIVILLAYKPYTRLPADPVLTKEHAAALIELEQAAPPDGVVWTWWDYGYAAQHFTGLETFADGRRNSGEYLFTLGVALGSESTGRSADMIRFAAGHDYVPWETWASWSESEFEAWLGGLGSGSDRIPEMAVQYVVLPWEAISSLPWIQTYASWDFETGQGQRSRVLRVGRPESLDLENGQLTYNSGQVLTAVSVDRLMTDAGAHYDYPANSGGPHLLLNEENGEVMLLDERAYRSTFIQLLIRPEEELSGVTDFELVLNAQPAVRVFALR
jgi:hypothetical protein